MLNDPNRLRGWRVLVMGLGSRQGGLGVARYLVEQGAQVRVTDLRPREGLTDTLADLAGLPIGYTLGEHVAADFDWADVVVRNPAVRAESSWLAYARERGKRVEMEMTLFFRACLAPIVGVTGTKGKTTTTTLLHAMLLQKWPTAALAGNMGRSALEQLATLDPNVPVALELSSFQLEALDEHEFSPHVAVITNISEDHLDRYPSFDAYARVKGAVARHGCHGDRLVSPARDVLIDRVTLDSPMRRVTFGVAPHTGRYALWIESDHFGGRWAGEPIDLGSVSALRLPGEHSRLNALAAAGAALALGVSAEHVRRAIAAFSGVPNRLEHVATIAGVDYVNDSAATAPAAAIAALRAYAGRDVVVIAGGSEKHLALDALADELAVSARRVVLLAGAATPRLESLLRARGYAAIDGPHGSMEMAVRAASAVARAGSVVLLSPGCASFGLFRDEFHRGDEFKAVAGGWQGRPTHDDAV
jgi:UDP-N-acetylmuramoylalanine--D-glutamate ligase